MLAKKLGLRSTKQYAFFNGALPCKLYCISVHSDNTLKNASTEILSSGATMFANRLDKNVKHLQKWASKNNISCYRIYDADLPEYAFAIDVYNDFAVLQEYQPPSSVPAYKAEKRRLEAIKVVPTILQIPPKNLVVKSENRKKAAYNMKNLDNRKIHAGHRRTGQIIS